MALTVTHPFVCALADDPVADAAGEVVPSDWNADHTIVVTSLTIATGTITADEPVLDLSQTWNNGAVTFTGIKLNVTNTASASASLLADFQVGGVSKAQITVDGKLGAGKGYVYALPQFFDSNYGAGSGFQIKSDRETVIYTYSTAVLGVSDQYGVRIHGSIGMGFVNGHAVANTPDVVWFRDAAATLALRNGTNAQTFRAYGTYTDSSNYVRASLASSSTAITLAAETAGTGADNVPVNIAPAGTEGVQIGNFAQLTEMTAPAAGASNTARIFAEDNGSGKTRLMVQFASGAAQQIAIEP